MLGNFRLRNAENFLEMADAKWATCKQMDDPQARGVTTIRSPAKPAVTLFGYGRTSSKSRGILEHGPPSNARLSQSLG